MGKSRRINDAFLLFTTNVLLVVRFTGMYYACSFHAVDSINCCAKWFDSTFLPFSFLRYDIDSKYDLEVSIMQDAIAQVLTAIHQYDTIIIHRHVNPDPDAIGSQVGLATVLRHAFPDKNIYAVGPDAPTLAWIGPQQTIDQSIYQGALVIVIDTANTARIAGDEYTLGQQLIKIDHHPNREPFGDIQWVDPEASSCSEMVADLITYSDDLQLTKEAAACLYAGIIGDTGRFLYDLTTPRTHEVAADLLRTGIDAPAIGRREDEFSPKVAKLLGYALTHVAVSDHGAGSLIVSQDLIHQLDLHNGQEQSAVGFIGKLNTIKDWAVFTERPDGKYRVELRSKTIPIQPLAIKHGGGGHPLASGAVADDLVEVNAIIGELDALNR
jgi:phosphoesterase RecJ-like protein